jgi:aminomethyltransferase
VLEPGGVQYSAILSDEGTFVDDATVYRFDDKIMIVVNAANRAKAWEHIVDQKKGTNVRLRDISDDIGLLAVQGPSASRGRRTVGGFSPGRSRLLQAHDWKDRRGGCFVSRTGYTGEDGFELYCRGKDTQALWDAVLKAGAKPSDSAPVIPCGSKWAMRSTATTSTRPSRRSRRDWAGS